MMVSQRIIDLLRKAEAIEKKLQEQDAQKDGVNERGPDSTRRREHSADIDA